MENNAELVKQWNQILADEGLSVWAGHQDARLWDSMDEFSENVSNHPRSYVPRVRLSFRLSYYPMVFSLLSDEDRIFFRLASRFKSHTIARHFKVTPASVRKRFERLKRKIEQQVKRLSAEY